MKIISLFIALVSLLPFAAEAGRMGPHWGNRGSACNSIRSGRMCRKYHAPPRHKHVPPEPNGDCDLVSTTAPVGSQLAVKLYSSEAIYVDGKGYLDAFYKYSREESTENNAVYLPFEKTAPANATPRIAMIEMKDAPRNHTLILLSWENYEEWIDCPPPPHK